MGTHTIHSLAVFLSLGVMGACAGYEVTDQPLTGKVGSNPWTFVEGYTDDFLSDEDSFRAELYPADVDECGFFRPGAMDHLLVRIPTATGEYELSLQQNMTYVVYDEEGPRNLVATEGVLVVESIDATTIMAGLHSRFDGDNEVDGNFEITICPPR